MHVAATPACSDVDDAREQAAHEAGRVVVDHSARYPAACAGRELGVADESTRVEGSDTADTGAVTVQQVEPEVVRERAVSDPGGYRIDEFDHFWPSIGIEFVTHLEVGHRSEATRQAVT